MVEDEIDPCHGCGRENVLDGPDVAAHWNTPFGSEIVAWSCSPECSERVEQQRDASGTLTTPTVPERNTDA